MKADMNKLGFILASPHRTAIVKSIDKMYTSTAVWKKAQQMISKMSRSHCTRSLTSLAKEGIVICVNPQSKIGRIYKLTTLGEELRKVLTQEVGTLF